MPVRHRASTPAIQTTGQTAFSLTIPSGTQTGDLLYLLMVSRDHTAGTGFPTCTDNDTGGNLWARYAASADRKLQVYAKIATSGTASKTVTVNGSVGSTTGGLSVFSGVNTAVGSIGMTGSAVEAHISGAESATEWTDIGEIGTYVVFGLINATNDTGIEVTNAAGTKAGDLEPELWSAISTGGNDCYSIFFGKMRTVNDLNNGTVTWSQTDSATITVVTQFYSTGVSGLGAITLDPLVVAGAGTSDPPPDAIAGNGAITLDDFVVAGSGTYTPQAITGTGATTLDDWVLAGTGTYTPEAITGTGPILLDDFVVDGAGTHINPITGSGAVVLDPFVVDGLGIVGEITGTGAIVLSPFVVAGAGVYTPPPITGTGAINLSGFLLAGTGFAIAPITGTGAINLASFTLAGTGFAIAPITGTGAILLDDFVVSRNWFAGHVDFRAALRERWRARLVPPQTTAEVAQGYDLVLLD